MKCPICAADLEDLYPKVRCRRCGYIESCCQPEIPCAVLEMDEWHKTVEQNTEDIIMNV